MEITYQQRIGLDGQPLTIPFIPSGDTADEIETIVAAEGAAVMTDEQVAELSAHLAERVTPDGVAR